MIMSTTSHRADTPPARVLVVGPAPTVRGGITSVVQACRRQALWRQFHCRWLATYDDRGQVRKVLAFARALLAALWLIPAAHVVHIHAAHRTSFCRKTIFFLLARLFGKKTVVHLHAPDLAAFDRGPLRLLARYVFSRADVVIALSGRWKDCVRRIAPGARVVEIPNPCPAPDGVCVPATARRPFILYAGKLEPRKGYHDLLRALPGVLASRPDVRLLMAGHGEAGRARRLAAELGVAAQVDLLGWVSAERLRTLFSQVSVFCLPSHGEGVPMAMLEAMSHRLPVLVTPVGGIPDIVCHGKNGLLVCPGDPQALAEALLKLIESPALRETLAENAYRSVVPAFTPEVTCRQIADVYTRLTQNDAHYAAASTVVPG